jgi:hypothetical protein
MISRAESQSLTIIRIPVTMHIGESPPTELTECLVLLEVTFPQYCTSTVSDDNMLNDQHEYELQPYCTALMNI